jgi:hypothetical protein
MRCLVPLHAWQQLLSDGYYPPSITKPLAGLSRKVLIAAFKAGSTFKADQHDKSNRKMAAQSSKTRACFAILAAKDESTGRR